MTICEYNNFSNRQKDLVRDILSDKSTKRKRVLGNAGSGKTTIITYCASKLLSEGKTVFVCCYNKTLLRQIRYMIATYGYASFATNITVDNYHHFMWHYLNIDERKTFKEYEYSEYPPDPDGYRFDYRNKKPMFDFIFVDEMQDLRPKAIANLIDLLRNEGKICVFADKYQKIYDNNKFENEEENVLSNVPKFPDNTGFRGRWTRLNEIYRANNLIQEKGIEFAKKYLFSSYGSEDIILSGNRSPSEINYYTHFSYSDLLQYIKKLTIDERNGTVILVNNLNEINEISALLRSNNVLCVSISDSKESFDVLSNGVKISTVKSFKGLEVPICIYFCQDDNHPDENNYVGVTRATNRLLVCNNCMNSAVEDIYSQFQEK